MNYEESILILDKIKKANTILLNCHRGADPDGIGSTLSLKLVLEDMGKKVDVICPSKKVTRQVDYLKGYQDIKVGIDFEKFDFSEYELFITLDTPNLSLLIDKDIFFKADIFTIVIDHHFISTLTGDIKLLDSKATSVGEILFDIYKDWGILLDKKIAECLLTSIIGDTGALAYPNVTSKTLLIVSKLMELGADKNMVVNKIYRSENFDILKFYSKVLSRMEIDKERRFVWSFVPYEVYKTGGDLEDVKAKSSSLFAPIVKGTDFGFIGVEERPKYMTISFRGRTDFDTSAITKELGGGGHKIASAAKIEGLSFEKASEKVLDVVRKYAKKS
ncbi:hypothetical protein A2422_02660 [Candidatus Woesebacteria bacterium RIFOXYC1_FULL_31_51]|uniref:Phosphoesterase RecJ domain protein n=1 Tax=Candidatus Woesebacteria bacterium GW2011_GWC2_31_9 TaxID=1618586 RepID=A0A0F9YY25_9BACT|nr:MAG: phosphoesterase RecJ domain-containing protein, phosphoesterase RecJ domain-containing protein [Candidatus Woesebacteria bacterium GW2011_GWF1_31_35]KKP23466.1 MAG: Phosphoesterase RecJ domain protein [Candidatus Woesebacteria bacterium GW2011_GWC1_30_29]KKP26443.1 MAG: Phosphoesterase RecJ domain protein [Candidatus Woesebacteria bacterium GW2011_GWD1_31_12]KKP27742.1 MAG: Phosphoesterase RecJ domain protein [Candidatus Woesebacteria bacterium GW2011_GWB1_31_29]KKP31381.1 MAG: Phosphoe